MTRIDSFIMFANVILLIVVPFLASAKIAFNFLPPVCDHNPSLSMCAGATGNADNLAFNATDASINADTRFIRDIPKMNFDEFQINRYCSRHQSHYKNNCIDESEVSSESPPKVPMFCFSFKKYCPDLADKVFTSNTQLKRRAVAAGVPLVIPPPLPFGGQSDDLAFDSPLPSSHDNTPVDSVPERAPETALSPTMIATCTPDCTAPHCTNECKCANTHPSVHAKCNPPTNATITSVCQTWYAKCPMFKPVSY